MTQPNPTDPDHALVATGCAGCAAIIAFALMAVCLFWSGVNWAMDSPVYSYRIMVWLRWAVVWGGVTVFFSLMTLAFCFLIPNKKD